jgi:hypothetical protein
MPSKNIHQKIFAEGAIRKVVPFTNHKVNHGLYEVGFEYNKRIYDYLWRPRILEKNISRAIPRTTYYKREVLFYEVASYFGIDHAPFATIFKLNGYIGSLQTKINGEDRANNRAILKSISHYPVRKLPKLVFLDFICANLDRHLGNVLVTKTGKIWLIDNGLTFTTEFNHRRLSSLREQAIRRFYNRDEMTQVASKFEKKYQTPEYKIIQQRIIELLGKNALVFFEARLEKTFLKK